jgi:siroheme synthase (precorrin-2 oxidase/ferrochelatase)
MNKDELKEKADHLKERVKEAFGDNKKKAGDFIDRMRETVRQKTDKTDARRDVSQDDDV